MSHTRHASRPAFVLFAASLLAMGAVGCKSTQTEQYSVELHNASDQPVTVWLTKTGDRRGQPDWLAPEDLSTSRAASVEKINGEVLPPGRTGSIGPLPGEFGWEDRAMLRVYAGTLTFDQLLATMPDGVLRVDVPLDEGMNRLVVRGPRLRVERNTGRMPATAPTNP